MIGKLLSKIIKIIFIIFLLLILLFYYYILNYIPSSFNEYLLAILIFYLVILYFFIIILGIIKKYKKITYVSVFVPIIPILLIYIRFYQTRGFLDTDVIFILFSYMILTALTVLFLQKTSSEIIGNFVGKEIGFLGDDFFVISIFSNYFDTQGDISTFVKDIINNILNYKLVSINQIKLDNKTYKVIRYSRNSRNSSWYTENLLLLEFDIDFDGDIEDFEDFKILDDNEGYSEFTTNCIYLYQFYDLGDEIKHIQSNDNDIYLAIKAMVSDYALIYYYKNDDLTPQDMKNSVYKIIEKYLNSGFGSLMYKTIIHLNDMMIRIKDSHKKAFQYIVFVIIIFYFMYIMFNTLYNFLISQDTVTSIIIVSSIIVSIHSIIAIYDRIYKNKFIDKIRKFPKILKFKK